jgi:hypothetical protein
LSANPYTFRSLGSQGEAWERASSGSIAVVFVHGWTGAFHETWTWTEKRKGWKRLQLWGRAKPKHLISDFLVNETDIDVDYYAFGHRAGGFDLVGVH